MNDQRLLEMLRAIDRPVVPARDFADSLYAVLEHRTRPRRRPSREMLLAAALLAAAAAGTAIFVGSQLLKEQQPVVVAPSPAPTTGDYTVSIPFGVTPDSSPEEVAAEASQFGLLTKMTLIVAGTQYPVDGGLTEPLDASVWEVVLVRSDGRTVTYFLQDDDPRVRYYPAPVPSDYPEPTLVVLPTWDPSVPLELVSDRGRTIRPTVVTLPGVEATHRIEQLAVVGDVGWAMVTDADTGDMVHLVRIDGRTGTAALVEPARDLLGTALHAGRGRLWLESSVSSEIYELDPNSGQLVGTVRRPVNGSFLGEDAEGLWFRSYIGQEPEIRAGAALVDPETGTVLRRIDTPVQDGPYRGFWNVPVFGSLWDASVAGVVYRVDAVSGEVQAVIDTASAVPGGGSCTEPLRVMGAVRGIDDLMVSFCNGTQVAIDAATNTIAFVVPAGEDPLPLDLIPRLAGQRWEPRTQEATSGSWVGTLVRFDLVDGLPIETLSFNRERVAGGAPVVIGDDVWVVAGEQTRVDDPFVQNQVLLRIPVSELTG